MKTQTTDIDKKGRIQGNNSCGRCHIRKVCGHKIGLRGVNLIPVTTSIPRGTLNTTICENNQQTNLSTIRINAICFKDIIKYLKTGSIELSMT